MQLIAILEAVQRAIPSIGDALLVDFHAFSQAAAPIFVNALWQGAAVASGLAICLRLAPRMSAAHRFAIWAAGFVALVCLPFLPLFSHFMAATPAGIPSSMAQASATPWLQLDIRWSLAIAALWAVASLFRAVDLAIHSFRLRKLWKAAIPVEPGDGLTFSLAGLSGLWGRKPVRLCTTQQLNRPSVIGFFAPRILIPDWLFARLTPGELEQIVFHEAEHLRRGDDWTNLVQKLCLVLFPLNPALWWMERRLCSEREMACDDGVVRVTHAPRAYAACLASIAERGLQRRAEALSLGAWQRRPELVHRVHSILARNHALSPMASRFLLGALGCGLVFGSVELARCPQLIAFAPARNVEAARLLTSAQPRIAPARLVNAAFASNRESEFLRTAHGLRATGIKANMPAGRHASHATERGSVQHAVPQSFRGIALNASASRLISKSPRKELLKAELPGNPQATSVPEQQWIVLTTWEQVQTSGRARLQPSDYDAGQSVDEGTSEVSSQPNGQSTGRITVTRLILRVIPVDFVSTHPAALPVRGGWFVIQL